MLNYLQRWIDQLRWPRLRTLSETGVTAGSPGRYPELLPDQGSSGGGGSCPREYQVTAASRSWLQEPTLSAAEGPAYGRDQDRICGLQESGLECGSHRIPAESPIFEEEFARCAGGLRAILPALHGMPAEDV